MLSRQLPMSADLSAEPMDASELRADLPDDPLGPDQIWLRFPHLPFPKPPLLPSFAREQPTVRMTTLLTSFDLED